VRIKTFEVIAASPTAIPVRPARCGRRVTGRGHGQPLGAGLGRCPVALGETSTP
jgi:hypothetical protein